VNPFPVPATRLTLIVPGKPDQRTGGYLYDARIVEGLRALGRTVEVVGLDGRFPRADETARRAMREALAAMDEGGVAVIDGLALGGVPESVAPYAHHRVLIGLVHHPLADETGLAESQQRRLLASERAALSHCRSVIVTSPFTRRRLRELHLINQQPVHVVEPGVDPAPLACRVEERLNGRAPEDPSRLLCVASLSPRKGQDVLLEALSRLSNRPWTLQLVGSPDRAPDFARTIRDRIRTAGLGAHVSLVGEVDARRLAELYDQADVCLLPSWYEGYGMVVTEALARGLPLIATTGGALQDTLPDTAALRVEPGRVDALCQAIERWLDDPGLRLKLTRAALNERAGLSDWPTAAQRFANVLATSMDPAE